jgi:hypothetical protein
VKPVAWIVPVLLTVLHVTTAEACTGIAVYSGERPLYGMNFDYPSSSEVAFETGAETGRTVFRLLFREDGSWIPTAAMNDRGLFASMQYQCPMVEDADPPGEGEVYVWNVFGTATGMLSATGQVRGVLEEVVMVHASFPTLHLLVADPRGDALIAEVGEGENAITDLDGDFIVMTNFRNADFPDQNPESVAGIGADRFAVAHHLLTGFEGDCGPAELMGILSAARSHDQTFVTRVSMVFDPEELAVYICLDTDYDRMWRASLESCLLEEWSGDEAVGTGLSLSGRPTGTQMSGAER